MNSEVPQSTSTKPAYYVGLGASAGGLEAIESFFTNMPPDTDLAFVVIQHLSPDYKSMMVELLTKKTKMPVLRAEDGMEVCSGSIYLIPPKKNLTIFHGKLLLNDKTEFGGVNLPIDIFLQSLAEDQRDRAIAVILSGTGSDGARGVRAIKENNGIVIVQEEQSAKFDGMPRAAISTGAADIILPPEKMPDELLAIISHPYLSGKKKAETLAEDSDAMTKLFAELHARTKVDFTYYKPSTITRRIERRMSINQIDNFEDYVAYLQGSPGEATILHRELLIGVTSFFRDPEAMQELRQNVLPKLLKETKKREIRCWVAGCSSGEEAYSIAILFKEVMEEIGSIHDVKIFATDVDREAIVKASTGLFPESIVADLKPRILGKYFYHREDSYHIARHIREMVVFAQHNLIKDPPFTNIDLVSCRNLLIYLQPVLQQRAIEAFNFSLNNKGILFLGSSETIGEMTDYFRPLHKQFRIYQSRGRLVPLRQTLHPADKGKKRQFVGDYFTKKVHEKDFDSGSTLMREYLDTVARMYFPLSVIVNERLEAVHLIGDSRGFLSIPSGRVEYNITKMAAKELAIPLATGIQKVFSGNDEVIYSNVHLSAGEEKKKVNVRICLLPQKKGREAYAAVFFEELEAENTERLETKNYDLNKDAQQRIHDLEQELQFAKENLQATIEELETSNEELQATNEELLASNEELQSTNEELQSTNEELYTVNAEHQNKIIELTELSNDVENLLTSSRIGTLIVDEELAIRKFSPEISHIFNILEKDIGRPFNHISHHLNNFDPVEAVQRVQKTNNLLEEDVQTNDGHWYLARILPYHIGPSTYSGIVLTFIDITDLKTARSALNMSEARNKKLSDNIPVGLLVYHLNDGGKLVLESSNTEAEKIAGKPLTKWHGYEIERIWPELENTDLLENFHRVMQTGEPCLREEFAYEDDTVRGVFYVYAFRLPSKRLAVSFTDISAQVVAEDQLERSREQYDLLFDTMSLGVVTQDRNGKIIGVNPAAEKILGLSKEQLQGLDSYDGRWQAVTETGEPLQGKDHPAMLALRSGKAVEGFKMGIYSDSETPKWLNVNATPLSNDGEGTPYMVFTLFEDISNKVSHEKAADK